MIHWTSYPFLDERWSLSNDYIHLLNPITIKYPKYFQHVSAVAIHAHCSRSKCLCGKRSSVLRSARIATTIARPRTEHIAHF